ncbi:zeta toxin family protein [Phycicoccus flavus]|uniref:zeta toxin family protein n=1 Tax=Phycicoccus flavus TaxID=2502783 RepID=UPI000FEBE375|nr:zeta toxin family protein [Phycicoccus flavus]NHA69972.1 hypothetical protein [Phycicoccus flavus]
MSTNGFTQPPFEDVVPGGSSRRAATAQALEGLLEDYAHLSTSPIPADAASVRLHTRIADAMIRTAGVPTQGKAVVLAGPPGAGKSTVLDTFDLGEFVRVDPDEIKTRLLDARRAEFAAILLEPLPDGRPVRLYELATLVHQESVALSDQIQQRLLQDRVNVVLEGTLRWAGQPAALAGQLRIADYQDLHILAVEASCATATDQALSRWWTGRATRDGARYTPKTAVTDCYPDPDGYSSCLTHAMQMLALPDVRALDHADLTVHHDGRSPQWTAGDGVAPTPADL